MMFSPKVSKVKCDLMNRKCVVSKKSTLTKIASVHAVGARGTSARGRGRCQQM